MPKKISDIRNHTISQKKDWETIRTLFHNLKGTGKTYGFAQISLICEPLENICDQFLKHGQTDDNLELLLLGVQLLEQITNCYQNKIELSLTDNTTAMRLLKLTQTSKNKV